MFSIDVDACRFALQILKVIIIIIFFLNLNQIIDIFHTKGTHM